MEGRYSSFEKQERSKLNKAAIFVCACAIAMLIAFFGSSRSTLGRPSRVVARVEASVEKMRFTSSSALLTFTAFTILHILIILVSRSIQIFQGKAKSNSFVPSRNDGPGTFIGRVSQAHANCIENLVLFACVVLTNKAFGGPKIDQMAWYYMTARFIQSIIHWSSVSELAVTLRFTAFVTSLVLLIIMGFKTFEAI
mmetsp:Transcript_9157/g.13745  ORF Transcript_9157/g.13745 Transcript_9157/m.13745 type:complete len:196 (+) Transcript_9157:100-687(+)